MKDNRELLKITTYKYMAFSSCIHQKHEMNCPMCGSKFIFTSEDLHYDPIILSYYIQCSFCKAPYLQGDLQAAQHEEKIIRTEEEYTQENDYI